MHRGQYMAQGELRVLTLHAMVSVSALYQKQHRVSPLALHTLWAANDLAMVTG
jgi:hypothetical protein